MSFPKYYLDRCNFVAIFRVKMVLFCVFVLWLDYLKMILFLIRFSLVAFDHTFLESETHQYHEQNLKHILSSIPYMSF